MPFQEKSAIAMTGALAVVYGAYFAVVAWWLTTTSADEIVYQPLMVVAVVPLVIVAAQPRRARAGQPQGRQRLRRAGPPGRAARRAGRRLRPGRGRVRGPGAGHGRAVAVLHRPCAAAGLGPGRDHRWGDEGGALPAGGLTVPKPTRVTNQIRTLRSAPAR